MRSLMVLALALPALGSAVTFTADFDSKPEGTNGATLTDDGITFSNGYNGLWATNFVVENATGELGSPFTPRNGMTLGGYLPGPGASFGRTKSFDFGVGLPATAASLDIWNLDAAAGNTVRLVGLSGGNVVASSSYMINSAFVIQHRNLAVTGLFDSLRLEVSGPSQDGASFLVFDNVTVEAVPEPATLLVLGAGLAAIARRRRAS